MLWMETYLFYCSVRLGVVVVATLTIISLAVPVTLLLTMGASVFDRLVEIFHNDDYYKKQYLVVKVLNWIENHTENFIILLNVYLLLHMTAAGMAIFAALKLKKWFLVPFSVLELLRVVYCLTFHIILMIVLKKILNLGILIAVTLAGGFFILYLAYNWASTIALFQIITLVHSQRYRALYGDDPFHPQPVLDENFGYKTIENVRVLVTPNPNDIDEQKLKFHNSNTAKEITITKQPIISVLPSHLKGAILPPKDKISQQSLYAEQRQQEKISDQTGYSDYVDYNYWQWSELIGDAAPKKSSHLITGYPRWA